MDILDQLEIKTRIETGDRYVSDIGEVDISFGNHLLNVIGALKEANEIKFANFHKFTMRKPSEKLYLSTETDPKRFIRQLRAKYFSKDSDKNKTQRDALPLIYFHRAGGLDQSLDGDTIQTIGVITEEGISVAEVDESPITLNYMVYVMAWDQQTLDKLTAGITTGLLTNDRGFDISQSVLSLVHDTKAQLTPVNGLSWVDMSPANTDDRLLVYQATFEVKASIFQARCIQESFITLLIEMPKAMYCSKGDI